LLVAKEDDLVLEKSFSNLLFGKILRKVDPEYLGPKRSRDSPDFYGSTLMFWLLMIEP
jgi:hypothetical protein